MDRESPSRVCDDKELPLGAKTVGTRDQSLHTASSESSDLTVRKVDRGRCGSGTAVAARPAHPVLVLLTAPFSPGPHELYKRSLFSLRKQPVFLSLSLTLRVLWPPNFKYFCLHLPSKV